MGDDVPLRLGVRVPAASGLEVRATVFGAVLSRLSFERTLKGERLGSRLGSRAALVDDLPVVGADRVLTLPLQDPALARDPNRIRLSIPGSGEAGVYPVEIELRDPDSADVVDSFVTDLVAVRRRARGEAPVEPLRVAWVWHITAPPSIGPTGAPSPAFARDLAPTGHLGRIATALDGAGDVPLTLVPTPETVAGLKELAPAEPAASTLETLRAAAAASPVLASPYTTVNGPSLLRAGLGDAFTDELLTGRSTLESGLDAAVDRTIAPTQPLDDPTLAHLRSDGGSTRLIVAPESLSDAGAVDQFTPARPFRLDTGAGSFDAVEVNRTTSDLLVAPGAAALRAQQLLAALSVVALEQPNRTRGVVIDTPVRWRADPTRVDAVLAGLRDHPLLEGASVADLFDTVPAATVDDRPYTRTLAPVNPPASPTSAATFTADRKRIDGLGSMIGASDPLIAQLRRQQLLSPASGVPGTGPSVSRARSQQIATSVGLITEAIKAPESRTVQLTSRQAPIPISMENRSGRVVRVRISLESQKLEFPKGSQQIVRLGKGNTTTSFDVEARASGTFPVLITVTSPDGTLDLQHSRYTVRSSVVSGVGLFLTIGAGLFLAGWWVIHWRRGRHPRASLAT